MSRRAFFGRIARGATAAATTATACTEHPPRGPAARAGGLAIPERNRRLALLRELAGDAVEVRYPLPTLEAKEVCRDHGVCSAVCPTGALRRYSSEKHGGLEFDAAACIECASCIAACDGEALAFGHRTAATPAGARTLTRRMFQPCRECDAPTPGADGLCRTCRDCGDLAREGAAELFAGGEPRYACP